MQRITAADLSARFGTTTTELPALLPDWKNATVQAAIEDAARERFFPLIEAALDQAELDKGQPLERKEARAVITAVEKVHMPRHIPVVAPAILKDPRSKDQAVTDSLADGRARLPKLKDPFTPVALNVPQARAKETILWESPTVMVLVDTFAPHPKALVIPKRQMAFPVDATRAELEELARVAKGVSNAFNRAARCGDSEIWINPPQDITIRQLHVHVNPPLPKGKPTAAFIAAVTKDLSSRL
jgi:diadenosine tetraphosphate (Ap4A) HIT family hydrolase